LLFMDEDYEKERRIGQGAFGCSRHPACVFLPVVCACARPRPGFSDMISRCVACGGRCALLVKRKKDGKRMVAKEINVSLLSEKDQLTAMQEVPKP